MENKTAIQYVIEFMSKRKKAVTFTEIIEFLKSKGVVSEDNFNDFIINFYQEFSTDSSFAFLGNNTWTLSNRVKFDDVKHAEYDEDDDNIDMISKEDEEGDSLLGDDDKSDSNFNENDVNVIKTNINNGADDDDDDNY